MVESKFQIRKLLNYIDFDALIAGEKKQYPNLLGFYESKIMGENISESISEFLDFFSDMLPGAQLFSTSTNFPERSWEADELSLANDVLNKGWFRFDLLEDEIEKKFSFSILSKPDMKDLNKLLFLILKGMTDGYVFIFFEKVNLVAYPHKYEGFGFMADNGTEGFCLAIQFLERIKNKSGDLFLVDFLD